MKQDGYDAAAGAGDAVIGSLSGARSEVGARKIERD